MALASAEKPAETDPTRLYRAARLLGATEALLEVTGAVLPPEDYTVCMRALTEVRADVKSAMIGKAMQEGRGMSIEQVIRYALEDKTLEVILGY